MRLQYASRAKRIKTNAIVNEDTNDRIIRELRAEIERLRKEVAGQQKSASPVVSSSADEEVQRLRAQLEEQQRMIEEMNLQWQEQLREQVRAWRQGGADVPVMEVWEGRWYGGCEGAGSVKVVERMLRCHIACLIAMLPS